jgi:hypothetical protein
MQINSSNYLTLPAQNLAQYGLNAANKAASENDMMAGIHRLGNALTASIALQAQIVDRLDAPGDVRPLQWLA